MKAANRLQTAGVIFGALAFVVLTVSVWQPWPENLPGLLVAILLGVAGAAFIMASDVERIRAQRNLFEYREPPSGERMCRVYLKNGEVKSGWFTGRHWLVFEDSNDPLSVHEVGTNSIKGWEYE